MDYGPFSEREVTYVYLVRRIRSYAVGVGRYPSLPCHKAPAGATVSDRTPEGADLIILWARLSLASMYAHRLHGCKQYATFTDNDPWVCEGG